MTIKRDENLLPLWEKSHIVVLGNLEDRIWSKSEKFAPVLCGDSLQFLVRPAIQKCQALREDNCKNAFCQGILPPEEITIIHLLSSGNPDADLNEYWLLLKTLYGLRWSPRHWYNMINVILISNGLTPLLEEPCLYTGFITYPSNPLGTKLECLQSLGLCDDEFVITLGRPCS